MIHTMRPERRVRHPLARASALFASDWSTATGTSTNALGDGGTWQTVSNDNDILTVVDATGLAMPTPNCLRVYSRSKGVGLGCYSGQVQKNNLVAMGTGDRRYFRLYFRCAFDDDEGVSGWTINAHHPVEWEDPQVRQWEWNWVPNGGAGKVEYRFGFPAATYPTNRWIPCNGAGAQQYLDKNHTYRIEWAFERTAASTYTFLDCRIYDETGTLLFNGDGVGASVGAFRDASRNLTLAASATGLLMSDAAASGFWVGTNGSSNTFAANRDEPAYYAAAMVRYDDWCGAY